MAGCGMVEVATQIRHDPCVRLPNSGSNKDSEFTGGSEP